MGRHQRNDYGLIKNNQGIILLKYGSFFCYSDEASGHQACMNEHLPTANQIRDMHSVSRIC